MTDREEKSEDFYAVLELNKECKAAELRNAYKKLALKWHPDRCSASGDSKYVEESKKKFQAIHRAYSVLSDTSRRFLYDLGVYDCDDHDDENGMGDFLNEMASMMSHNSIGSGNESFEELKALFNEMFESEIESFDPTCSAPSPTTFSSVHTSYSESYCLSSKRNFSKMSSDYSKAELTKIEGFCLGVEHQEIHSFGRASRDEKPGRGEGRGNGRKRKISRGQDVVSKYHSSISA